MWRSAGCSCWWRMSQRWEWWRRRESMISPPLKSYHGSRDSNHRYTTWKHTHARMHTHTHVSHTQASHTLRCSRVETRSTPSLLHVSALSASLAAHQPACEAFIWLQRFGWYTGWYLTCRLFRLFQPDDSFSLIIITTCLLITAVYRQWSCAFRVFFIYLFF